MNMNEAIKLYGGRGLYLRGLSDEALSERLVHCLNNVSNLSRNGMVSLRAESRPDDFQRFLDAVAETGLRNGDIAGGQFRSVWDRNRNVSISAEGDIGQKISELNSKFPVGHSSVLMRVSSFRNMQELYEHGGLLFQEASTFAKNDNLSIMDDELRLELTRYIPQDELDLVPGAPPKSCFTERGWAMNFCLESPDFLVFCLANEFNPRMVTDWGAEAAVIIHDPLEFRDRVSKASASLLAVAGAEVVESGAVRYIDPYFPLESPDVPFCKHFKFAYQSEYRFVVRQRYKVLPEHRKLVLGSLADISTLVDLR